MGLVLNLLDIVRERFESVSAETRINLQNLGIDRIEAFEQIIIKNVKEEYPKLSLERISYGDSLPGYFQSNLNNALGTIENDKNEVKAFVILTPFESGDSRSGLIAQQLFPSLTTFMSERKKKSGNDFSNVPVIVINCNNETFTKTIALSIVSLEIMNIGHIDLYNRDANRYLFNETGIKFNTNNFLNYVRLIESVATRVSYFDYNEETNTLQLLTANLTNASMTNQPYYFLMKVIPLIIIAMENQIDIDYSILKNWYSNYVRAGNSNKNMMGFFDWIDRINDCNKKIVQKLFYGAPGTGKSHKIDMLMKEKNIDDENQFRVTFHSDFSYTDFVGQLVPVKKMTSDGNNEEITYDFYRGVFSDSLKRAFSIDEDVYLIVEEMSRGDVASIFGDIFQLLDRTLIGFDKGKSKYKIRNKRIADEIDNPLIQDSVYLPSNLHILGTVNTNDQNVYTIDTAFKRRFQWEYIPTDPINKKDFNGNELDEYLNNVKIILKKDMSDYPVFWVNLYSSLNKYITDKRYLGLGEDKQVGQFFIRFDNLTKEEIEVEISNKLFSYLWEDVANTYNSGVAPLFNNEEINSFSDLMKKAFSVQVFSNQFFDLLELQERE